ncbi:MAG: efflux RND transporter periplasmic adaptor subunit, partial [Kangiellaceae bacterium]|nr:efflux RND transporter periplasmic adaptor subunit [Kangiellaceae bacterium]
MNKKVILFSIIFIIIVGIPIIKKYRSPASKAIDVTSPDMRVIKTSVLASGRLAHEDEVRLTSEVIGRVKEVLVEEGDKVTAGQLLLVIDDTTFKATVDQRKAAVRMQNIAIERQQKQLDNLQRQWLRNKNLHTQKLLNDDAFELLTNQLELSRIDIKSARESLSQANAQLDQAVDQFNRTRVYSPIDGEVTSLDIKVGETAIASTTNIAGSSLMTIANPKSTITEVFVDEADVAEINIGQTAEIVAIAYSEQPIKGTVKSIATTAKTVAGRQGLSFLVKLSLDNSEQIDLKPGMSCRAEIFTSRSEPVLSL